MLLNLVAQFSLWDWISEIFWTCTEDFLRFLFFFDELFCPLFWVCSWTLVRHSVEWLFTRICVYKASLKAYDFILAHEISSRSVAINGFLLFKIYFFLVFCLLQSYFGLQWFNMHAFDLSVEIFEILSIILDFCLLFDFMITSIYFLKFIDVVVSLDIIFRSFVNKIRLYGFFLFVTNICFEFSFVS